MTAGDELGLEGRAGVVFGSATGIGAATARRLARAGASVLLADIADDRAAEVADGLRAEGHTASVIRCDVGEEADVRAAVERVGEQYGRVDFVHNNAAAMNLAPQDGMVGDVDPDHWDETFRINLRGQVLGCKYAVRAMKGAGGSIINTSSAIGVLGDVSLTAYSAVKGAVNQLTRSVATQYGRDRIRCNAVIPGLIDVQRAPGTGMEPTRRARLMEHQLLPDPIPPEDVADTVAFLAGTHSRSVTGALFTVDGGLTAHMPNYADNVREA